MKRPVLSITIITLVLFLGLATAQENSELDVVEVNGQPIDEAVLTTDSESPINVEMVPQTEPQHEIYRIDVDGEESGVIYDVGPDYLRGEMKPLEEGVYEISLLTSEQESVFSDQIEVETGNVQTDQQGIGGEEMTETRIEREIEDLDEKDLPENLTREDLENPEELTEEEIEQLQDAVIQENIPFQEETIDLSEQAEEIPGPIKTIVPGQKINVNLEQIPEDAPEQFPTELSVELDSDFEQIEISHDHLQDPTLEIWVDVTVMEDIEDYDNELEAVGDFIEEERIDFQAYGIFNRIIFFPIEHIAIRFLL